MELGWLRGCAGEGEVSCLTQPSASKARSPKMRRVKSGGPTPKKGTTRTTSYYLRLAIMPNLSLHHHCYGMAKKVVPTSDSKLQSTNLTGRGKRPSCHEAVPIFVVFLFREKGGGEGRGGFPFFHCPRFWFRILVFRFDLYHDQIMICSWENHDSIMIKSWLSYEKMVFKSWYDHDKIMILSW